MKLKCILAALDQRLPDGCFETTLAEQLSNAHRRRKATGAAEIEHDRNPARADW